MGFTLRWVADAIQGRIKQGDPEISYGGISTDTRTLQKGDVFWALKGERFDGHDFLGDAVRKGAHCLVIGAGRTGGGSAANIAIIEVADTLWALGAYAASCRRLYDIPLVAVTGSSGKTTTKEMIAAILSLEKRVLRNEGNLNNLIGLPLSLLKLDRHHHAAVLELGMNRRGEIARLTEIADPSVGVITNIGPVHLEHLGSIEAVAECKGELFRNMAPESTAVINRDDPRTDSLARTWPGKKVTFGIEQRAHIRAKNISAVGAKGMAFDLAIHEETVPVHLPIVGEHNVMNALAAAAATVALGENPDSISRGLKDFTNLKLRQEVVVLDDDIMLINDAYNANPVSMTAALRTFTALRGSSRGIAVLGDMLELGSQSAALHRQLGKEVAQSNVHMLLLMGEYASATRDGAIAGGVRPQAIRVGKDHKELGDYLEASLAKGDWVLVKGSRKMEMEQVASRLLHRVKSNQQRH